MTDMKRVRNDNDLLRKLLIGGVSLFALAPAAAMAQDSADPEEIDEEIEEDQSGDNIVVTGSRIRRSEFTSISPVQVISGEVSRDLGLVDAGEVLNQTSVVQGQQTTIGLSTVLATGQAFTTFGSVTPSLRGLSSSVTGRGRNLFLINGRRYGPIGVGGAPSNPDVSLIPGSLLQRVDLLLDGASSVYGSDAIAGVINYVLRDDFEGLELDAFYNTPEIGVAEQIVLSATFGIRSDNGFAVVAGEYNGNEGLTRGDRFPEFSPFIDTSLGPVACDPEREIDTQTGEVFSGCNGFLAGFGVFGAPGTIVLSPGETNIGVPDFSQLGIAPFDDPVEDAGTFGNFNNRLTRSFPQDQASFLRPPTQRFSVYSLGEYSVEDLYTSPTFYYETSYAERTLQTRGFNQGVIEVTENTPFNPGIGNRLLVSTIQTEVSQNVDVFRATGGIRGDLPFLEGLGGTLSNWQYDVFALFHRSRGTNNTFGDYNQLNLARFLRGGFDEFGNFQCALDESVNDQPSRSGPGGGFTTPTTDCNAINIFEPSFLQNGRFTDPASNTFLLANVIQNTSIDQFTVNGFVTGDLFQIPTGGTAQAVLGFEYRTDSVNTQNDLLQSTSNALAAANPDVGSQGDRRIVEGFGELVLPLVTGRKFVERFNVELAARYTEEEFFGSAVTWQAKGEWAPFDYLSFSGGYGTSFRAPDTGEQFGTGIIFANNVRNDPCLPTTDTLVTSNGIPAGTTVDMVDGNVPDGFDIPAGTVFFDVSQDERQEFVLNLCEQLGVQLPSGPLDVDGAAALGLFGIGTPSGSFQNFSVLFGNDGNEAINPETSRAFFAKVSFQQPWFDSFRLNFSANYFDYLIEDSIGQLTAGNILGSCFGLNNAVPTTVQNGILVGDLCEFQSRDPNTGLLTALNEASFNLGSITSRGIDFNLSADTDLEILNKLPGFNKLDGPINLGVTYRATWQFENNEDILGDGMFNENVGLFGFPDYQMNITTALRYDRWGLSHRVFYSTAQDNGINDFGGGNICSPELISRGISADEAGDRCTEFIDLPPVILHDIVLNYNADTWAVRVGVRNLLDTVIIRDTAIPGDGGSGTPFGLGFDADGRNFFFNVTKRF